MRESKAEHFRRVAEARVNKIVKMLRLLGNCARTTCYQYSEAQVKQIFDAIQFELDAAQQRYSENEGGLRKRFLLSCERMPTTTEIQYEASGCSVHAAFFLSWSEIGRIAAMKISRVIGREVNISCGSEDDQWWNIRLVGTRLSVAEQGRVFDTFGADAEDLKSNMIHPGEDLTTDLTIRDFTMEFSMKIIREALPVRDTYETFHNENGLWIIGMPQPMQASDTNSAKEGEGL